MSKLIIAEHDNQSLSPSCANLVAAVQGLPGDTHILVAGAGCQTVAEQAGKLSGVTKVLLVDQAPLAHQLAEDITELVLTLADQYQAIVAAASTTGKNLIPRLAALLDVQALSDVIEIESSTVFKRPIYAGNVIARVETSDAKLLLTLRTTAFDAADTSGSAPVETLDYSAEPQAMVEFVDEQLAKSDRPDLASAKVVLSGGRGMLSAENFQLLYDLADKLDAAVGASRAAVDAGFVPNDMQVGQTGKIVAPDLYIAFGISGAIQHLAGMKEAKVIVAVNTDEDAPIFQVADYGLVADLFEVLPEMNRLLSS